MQIAQKVAGFTLGMADVLRKAMGKKIAALMAEQRSVFVEGAVAQGMNETDAQAFFDEIETFGGYGFNKSHSVAYALVAYQTAWLKAHYPAEFMAAVLSADMDKTDKIANLIEDCRAMGLDVQPPDINASQWRFEVQDHAIRYGLGAIKGVGEGTIESLLDARRRIGRFDSLHRMLRETELAKLTRKTVETLIRAGALDSIHENRAALQQIVDDAWQAAEQHHADADSGQVSLFGATDDSTASDSDDDPDPPEIPHWSARQRLRGERETLGLYLSGHPMDDLLTEISGFVSCTLGQIESRCGGDNGQGGKRRRTAVPMTLSGLVSAMRRRPGKGAFVAIEDGTGRIEVAIFDRVLATCGELLRGDEIIVVTGKVDRDDFNGGYRMVADQVMNLDQARQRFASHLHLRLSSNRTTVELDRLLISTLRPYRDGNIPVIIDYFNGRARATLKLGDNWRVKPCAELLAAIEGVGAIKHAELVYKPNPTSRAGRSEASQPADAEA